MYIIDRIVMTKLNKINCPQIEFYYFLMIKLLLSDSSDAISGFKKVCKTFY